AALGALGIAENIGLVGALVDRRAAQFGQPDRLALRHPGCRVFRPHTARPVEMLVGPERLDILVAPDPGLIMRPVADRRANLRRPVGIAGIKPVKALTPRDIPAKIVEVMR